MKTILKFEADELDEAKRAIHAADLYCSIFRALEDLGEMLNSRYDLAFSEAQEDEIRRIISEMQLALDISE